MPNLKLTFEVWPWEDIETWGPEHAEALRVFSDSPIGKFLALHLRNASLQINARAIQSGDPHECDRAAGFMLCLSYIDSLSVSRGEPQSPIDEDSIEGAEEFLERMLP